MLSQSGMIEMSKLQVNLMHSLEQKFFVIAKTSAAPYDPLLGQKCKTKCKNYKQNSTGSVK